MELKIDMLYHMNNAFRNTVFYISLYVPLIAGILSSAITIRSDFTVPALEKFNA